MPAPAASQRAPDAGSDDEAQVLIPGDDTATTAPDGLPQPASMFGALAVIAAVPALVGAYFKTLETRRDRSKIRTW